MKRLLSVIGLLILIVLLGCRNDKIYPDYKTEHVIIVVIDGARYSETWGEPSHSFIPNQSILRHHGVVFDNFINDGNTYTVTGHAAITTGVYHWVNNGGGDLPDYPSIFQAWLEEYRAESTKAWVITSKDKLVVLGNTSDSGWNNQFMPSTNCGVNGAGLGSGYRDDSTTMKRCMEIFDQFHPNLVLLNFREPDYSAHQANWLNYLAGISKTDEYVMQIWNYIENDPIYKGKTTLLVTNDHGRHLNSVGTGFDNHGDQCEGCKHISLFAIGPDFPKNVVVSKQYDQRDIAQTVAELMHFNLNKGEGKIIWELLR